MLATCPKKDGFHMPAEFDRHLATCMIWPTRPGSWGRTPRKAQNAFANVIREIAKG